MKAGEGKCRYVCYNLNQQKVVEILRLLQNS